MNDVVAARVDDRTARRLELLENMRTLIQGTQHLSKVFDERWFDEVKGFIHDARDEPGLIMPTPTAFIGFFHDAFWDNGAKDLLAELEEAFHAISTTAKKTLREKLSRCTEATRLNVVIENQGCIVSKRFSFTFTFRN